MNEAKCAFPNCDCDTEIMCTAAHNSLKQIAQLEAEVERLREWNEKLYAALHNGLAGIFPPLDFHPDDHQLRTSAGNYREMRKARDEYRLSTNQGSE